MTRPTNPELVAKFREIMTKGFFVGLFPGSEIDLAEKAHTLEITKPWRAELWTLFNEIEERLCPLEVETRRREKAAKDGKDYA